MGQNRETLDRAEETKEQRIYRAAQQPGGYLWPTLRIGRAASFDYMDETVPDWNDFLNELGSKNKKRGHAKTLGQISCNYVCDTEMRSMILATDKNLRRRDLANKVYRTITKELDDFLEEQLGRSYRVDPGEFCERPELMGKTMVRGKIGSGQHDEFMIAPTAHPERLSLRRTFRPAQLTVRPISEGGVDVFDGNVYGLDLSDNRQLYEERHAIMRFLKNEQGLDPKNHARKDWVPHATIFILRPHLRADDIAMAWPKDQPEAIEFGEVRTFTD